MASPDDTTECNDPLYVSSMLYYGDINFLKSSILLICLASIHLLIVNSKLKPHLNTGGAFWIIQTAYDDLFSIKLLFEWYIALVMMYLAPGT